MIIIIIIITFADDKSERETNTLKGNVANSGSSCTY